MDFSNKDKFAEVKAILSNIDNSNITHVGGDMFKIESAAMDDFIVNGRLELHTTPRISIDVDLYRRLTAVLTSLTRGETARNFAFDNSNTAPKDFKQKMGQIMAAVLSDRNAKRVVEMFYEYNKALFSKNRLPDVRDPSTYDIIDVKSLIKEHDNMVLSVWDKRVSDEEFFQFRKPVIDYIQQSKFYAAIPCYKTGILDYSESLGVMWKTLDINLDEEYMELYIYSYMKPHVGDGGGLDDYVPYTSGIIRVEYNHDVNPTTTFPYNIYKTTMLTLTDLYQHISAKKFRWSQDDRRLWNNVIIKYIKLMDSVAVEHGKNNSYGAMEEVCNELYLGVVECFCDINKLLHDRKQSRQPRKVKNEPKAIHSFSKEKQEERKTIVIDGVTFYTTRPPQEMTRRTVVKYQVASWKVRGHIRQYKSGKEVYIQPHVKHRKNMNEVSKSVKPGSRTIRIDKDKK